MNAILVTIRMSIADLIGGTRGVSSGVRLGTLDVKKLNDIYCEKICYNVNIFENVHLKCTFSDF